MYCRVKRKDSNVQKEHSRSIRTDDTTTVDFTPREAGLDRTIVLIIGKAAVIIYLIDRVTRPVRNTTRPSRGIGFQGLPRHFLDLRAGLRKNLHSLKSILLPHPFVNPHRSRGWPLPGLPVVTVERTDRFTSGQTQKQKGAARSGEPGESRRRRVM